MSLEQWTNNSWLVEEEPTKSEIQQLRAVVDRALADANVKGLSADARYMLAYDVGLTLCSICLRASGYRAAKGAGHHKRTIESLVFTLGDSARAVSDEIELASRLRGQAMYDRVDVVHETDVEQLIETVTELRDQVTDWLLRNHPTLC